MSKYRLAKYKNVNAVKTLYQKEVLDKPTGRGRVVYACGMSYMAHVGVSNQRMNEGHALHRGLLKFVCLYMV